MFVHVHMKLTIYIENIFFLHACRVECILSFFKSYGDQDQTIREHADDGASKKPVNLH